MTRRVVAGLACRLGGARLYGKPLQNLGPGTAILDHIVECMRSQSFIDEVVLAIADEPENQWLADKAAALGCPHVFGDTQDVLERLIVAGDSVGATDLVRKTTESPYFEFDGFAGAWARHTADANDVTVVDHVPLGTAIEIYTMDTLRRSHAEGLPEDRSELVSNYARFNQSRFRIGIIDPPDSCRRMDLRLTVDYPEDLILCRAVYERFKADAPLIPLPKIVDFLDSRPDLKGLVAPYVHEMPTWVGAPQRR